MNNNEILYNKEDLLNVFHDASFFVKKENFFISHVTIDTREIRECGLFVALTVGTRDGHLFIKAAIKNQASCIVVQYIPEDVRELVELSGINVIIVKDTLIALENLAKFNRSRLKAKVIAITGNIGKTTTKEMIKNVFEKYFHLSVSPKSYNNHIGLPYTIANTSYNTELLILELGMNHLGEIAHLSKIARPHISIITTIAPAHIGNFENGIEDIIKAKAEIFVGMDQDGIIILNEENIYFNELKEMALKHGLKNIFRIGSKNSHIYVKDYEFTYKFSTKYNIAIKTKDNIEEIQCETAGVSYHNAFNTLFAFSIGKLFGLDLKEISDHISNTTIAEGRGNLEQLKTEGMNLIILNDSYNASPEAMKAAIRTLYVLGQQKKAQNIKYRTVAVLGDMKELGKWEEKYHQEVLESLLQYKIDVVLTVGNAMTIVHSGLPNKVIKKNYSETRFLVKEIRKMIKDGDIILFKASNSMGFAAPIAKLYR